jgi:probable rRNA maturation factor
LEIYSENLLAGFEVDTQVYGKAAERILASLVGPDGEGSVVFVSDKKIRDLNRTYRGVDRATDVLTFALGGGRTNRGVLGDVYISLETAERQAREGAVPLEEELLRLMIHGLLHLVGHTHDGKEDSAVMRRLERKNMRNHLRYVEGCARRKPARRKRKPREGGDGRRER